MLALALLGLFALVFAQQTDATFDSGCNNKTSNEIQCCVNIDEVIGFINIDGCADLIIDWDNLNITLALELNDVILFESTFGWNTPPELCTDIWGLHICLKLEDMTLKEGDLHGCLYLNIDNLQVEMGCFDIGQED